MTSDQLNRTGSIKYDHRNLMTEIRIIKTEANPDPFGVPTIDVLYLTNFRYDEDCQSQFSETAKAVSPTGNRVRKVRYKYTGSDPDPVFVTEGSNPSWSLQSDEFYIRDVSGKEIAIYSGSSLTQWNIWGLDNPPGGGQVIGKINADTTRNYYLKDHLGSIRVVLNSTNALISAQDYDAWGYPLENRTYNSSAMKYDFTGKERDDETGYDYFGARYYDSRIANWTSIDPLFEKHFGYSPYNYVLRSPLVLKDPNGKQVFVAFGGWGIDNEGEEILPSQNGTSTEQLLSNIQETAIQKNWENYEAKGWNAGFFSNEVEAAFSFVQDYHDLNPNEPIYLYGYSLGGNNIVELANKLNDAGINVDILFTVDAYKPTTGETFDVPENVKKAVNYYQPNTKTLPPSHGKTIGKYNNAKTQVKEHFYPYETHSQIGFDTKTDVKWEIINNFERAKAK